ncbi:HD-GYP domain-containing protein [Deinococcus planocerae]|uniref:HD-GYP domain-containing protein n=1 Tax=Deinococcus planocerae TaxID=1737569 RepID=UPI000C7E893C|nr:HD-GYP domain-containing protein [Deinococcus planocerae]
MLAAARHLLSRFHASSGTYRLLTLVALALFVVTCAVVRPPGSVMVFVIFLLLPWTWREGWAGLRWTLPLSALSSLPLRLTVYAGQPWVLLLTGLIASSVILVVIAWLRERELRAQRNFARTLQALDVGGLRVAHAASSAEVMAATLRALEQLGVSEDIALVGIGHEPRVLGASGGFAPALHQPLPALAPLGWSTGDTWITLRGLDHPLVRVSGVIDVIPVHLGEPQPHVCALILLSRPGGRAFPSAQRTMIDAVVRLFAARLAQHQAVQELRAAHEHTLLALGLALEQRDFETQGHTLRVAELSVALARALGLGEEAQELLRRGAYLHDVGKLGIPDTVLLKPGRLTPAERAVIEEHVTIGHSMLERLPFLPVEVLGIVRHHHERWDGTGYPDRLRGEAVPALARLFAVVDVYDALTSARPYKAPWPPERALAELERGAGTQFDPRIVEAFVRLHRQGAEMAQPA